MKKSRFIDSQIMAALKRVEAGLAVPDICREVGISTATLYKWRAKFGGMVNRPGAVHRTSFRTPAQALRFRQHMADVLQPHTDIEDPLARRHRS